jgi:hypothetical protein
MPGRKVRELAPHKARGKRSCTAGLGCCSALEKTITNGTNGANFANGFYCRAELVVTVGAGRDQPRLVNENLLRLCRTVMSGRRLRATRNDLTG